jgi:hypothetical protein
MDQKFWMKPSFRHFEILQVPSTILPWWRSLPQLWSGRDVDKADFLSGAWEVYTIYIWEYLNMFGKIHKPKKARNYWIATRVAIRAGTYIFLPFWAGTVFINLTMNQSCCLLCTNHKKTCILFYYSQDNVGTWQGSNISLSLCYWKQL